MSFSTLRKHCASLPGATRDIKWGADEVYSVGGKMFAVFGVEAGKATGVSFKVDEERFLELTDRPGIVPAPYLARAHWIALERSAALSEAEGRALLSRSHALVLARLPRKVQADIASKGAAPRARRAAAR